MSKEPEITLALNQTADTNTCGSCYFFRRNGNSEWENKGECKFKLPPKYDRYFVKAVWSGDETVFETVSATNTCNFWKSTGQTYIVSQRIKP